MESFLIETQQNPIAQDRLMLINILSRLKVCEIGEILEIKEATDQITNQKYNYFMVKNCYKFNTRSGVDDDPGLVMCRTINNIHYKTKYEVGDKVVFVYTDWFSGDYLEHDLINIYDFNEIAILHGGGNGVILFGLENWDKDNNEQVVFINDKANITIKTTDKDNGKESFTITNDKSNISIDDSNVITINNDKGTITIDDKGAMSIKNDKCEITADDQGAINIKNNSASIVIDSSGKIEIKSGATMNIGNTAKKLSDIILTDITTYVKSLVITSPVGPCTLVDAAGLPALQAGVKMLLE